MLSLVGSGEVLRISSLAIDHAVGRWPNEDLARGISLVMAQFAQRPTIDVRSLEELLWGTQDRDVLYEQAKPEGVQDRIRSDVLAIDDELIRFLQKHPEDMYHLHPRKFQELIGAILRDVGYKAELGCRGPDGGVDIIATQNERDSTIGELLLLVECKRYDRKRPVRVQMVRALYGLAERGKATKAMLVTTSYFTPAARAFAETVKHRLSLKDYVALVGLLASYKGKSA